MPEHQQTAWDALRLVKAQGHDLGGEYWTTHTKAPSELEHKCGANRNWDQISSRSITWQKKSSSQAYGGHTITLQCCTLTQFSEVTLG